MHIKYIFRKTSKKQILTGALQNYVKINFKSIIKESKIVNKIVK